MEIAKVSLIVALMFMVCINNMTEASKVEPGVLHIAGKVLCQDCTEGWKQWVEGVRPIKGCKVSVTCMDDTSRVAYYGGDLTNAVGEFEILVNKHVNHKELKPQNCIVRLVSSPDPVCNIATDFSGGRTGVKLTQPSIMYRDLVK
ncbi:hypothetical protein RJ641_025023 [Dillenia turbinata]|uniref:Uncharacterized protein n=1 Tax=Dillenia turbinata TaxID=194707 RepID=A0AAN8ZN39_9MAGN